MDFLLVGAFANYALGFSLFFISLFLIFIILIQRGRGGGLSGALGGTGQSAFGSRAGDEMTYITLIVSAIWIFLCVVCIWVLNPKDSKQFFNDDDIEQTGGEAGAGLNLGGGQDTSEEDSGEEATGTDDEQEGSGEEATGTDDEQEDSGEEEGDANTTPDESDDETPEPPTSEKTSSDDNAEPGDEPAEPESDGSNPDKPG